MISLVSIQYYPYELSSYESFISFIQLTFYLSNYLAFYFSFDFLLASFTATKVFDLFYVYSTKKVLGWMTVLVCS